MPKGRISKRTVDALTCPIGRDRTFLWDDAIAGFGVAAFRGGKKVYVAQYRKNGRSSRVAIGRHGRLTPDEARSEAFSGPLSKVLISRSCGGKRGPCGLLRRPRRTF